MDEGVPAGASGSQARLDREAAFHDEWALAVDPATVLVTESFQACTAPENRWIMEILGDVRGKRVLDLGCGLGEAAVFFATRGADVTASDVSPGMLELVGRVAAHHQVSVTVHCAPAEDTRLPGDSFDIVYAANVLHHIDTATGLDEIRRVLKPGGTFVSWDPLAHNPAINVYRRMAMKLRTVDEHPLRWSDLELFRSRFKDVRTRCFWLTTLLLFVRFYVVDRIHPSAERYWKLILTRADRLSGSYRPLERIDRMLLRAMPWLGRYCWNVVVTGRKAA